MGVFEQLFGPERGEYLNKNFPKIQMHGGLPGGGGGMLNARFDWYIRGTWPIHSPASVNPW